MNAQHARIIHHYKNTKEKLITAKQQGRLQHLKPKYSQTKVNGINIGSIATRSSAVECRINKN